VRLQNKLNYDKYILHINRASPSAEPPSTASNDVLLSNSVEPSNRNSIGSVAADTIQGDVIVQPSNPPPPPPPRPPTTAAPQPPPPRPTVFIPPSTRPPPPRTTVYIPPSTRPQPPPTPSTIAVRINVPTPPSTPQPRPQPPRPQPQPIWHGSTAFAGSSASASAGGASSFASGGAGSSFSSAGSAASASASGGSSVAVAGSATPVRKSPVALLGQVVSGFVRPITSILPAPLGPKGKNPGIVGSVVTGLLDELEGNLRVIYPGEYPDPQDQLTKQFLANLRFEYKQHLVLNGSLWMGEDVGYYVDKPYATFSCRAKELRIY